MQRLHAWNSCSGPGYDFAFKQKLTKGYAVYVTAYKHNVIAVRLRKDFNAFKLGAASTRGLR